MQRREFLTGISLLSGGFIFYRCGLAGPAPAPGQCSGYKPITINGQRIVTVDVHGHTFFPQVNQIIQTRSENGQTARKLPSGERRGSSGVNLFKDLTDLDLRLQQMDAMGIDIQIISPSPGQYNYRADRDLALQTTRIQNHGMAELAASHPDRFAAMGTVSLQHPELAVSQLEEGVKDLGLRGFMIGTLIGEDELSNRKFEKFWAKAEELGTVVFIHPLGSSANDRLQHFNMNFVIGTPLEEAVVVSHLIFGGVLDRYSKLKICIAHGGGYLPYYIGRSDNCYHSRQPCQNISKPPSEFLRQLYYDSRVFRPDTLRLLVDTAGASQVMLGTDYPFPVQDPNPAGLICHIPGLTAQEQEAILGKNALKLFGI